MTIETVIAWLEWVSVNQPGASWQNFVAIFICAMWLWRWWPMTAKWHKEKGHRWYWPADKLLALSLWPTRALCRWVAGRRKGRQLDKARWDMLARVCALPAEPAKPAPDRQYQGDQVTGIRKEVQELQSDFNRLHMSVQHLQADTQDLVDIRSRLFTLEGRDKPPTKWVTGGGSVVFSDDALAHKPAPAPEGKNVQQELLKPLIDRMRQRMDAPDYHGTPDGEPAPTPGYRVWATFADTYTDYEVSDGVSNWYMCARPIGIRKWEEITPMKSIRRTELSYLDRDAIVAEFLDWRAGQ